MLFLPQLRHGVEARLSRPVIVIRGRDADRLMTIVNSRRRAVARIKTDFPLGKEQQPQV